MFKYKLLNVYKTLCFCKTIILLLNLKIDGIHFRIKISSRPITNRATRLAVSWYIIVTNFVKKKKNLKKKTTFRVHKGAVWR